MRVWALASCGGVLALAACSNNTASTVPPSPPLLPDDWDFTSAIDPAAEATETAVEPQREVSAPTLPPPIPEQTPPSPSTAATAATAPVEDAKAAVASAQLLQTRLAQLRAQRGLVPLPPPRPPEVVTAVPPVVVDAAVAIPSSSPPAVPPPAIQPPPHPDPDPATDPAQGPVSYDAAELVIAETAPRLTPHPGHRRHLASGDVDLAPTLTALAHRYHGPSAPESVATSNPDVGPGAISDPTSGHSELPEDHAIADVATRHQGTADPVVLSRSTQTLSTQTLTSQAQTAPSPAIQDDVVRDRPATALAESGATELAVEIAATNDPTITTAPTLGRAPAWTSDPSNRPITLPLHDDDPSARLRAILAARAAAEREQAGDFIPGEPLIQNSVPGNPVPGDSLSSEAGSRNPSPPVLVSDVPARANWADSYAMGTDSANLDLANNGVRIGTSPPDLTPASPTGDELVSQTFPIYGQDHTGTGDPLAGTSSVNDSPIPVSCLAHTPKASIPTAALSVQTSASPSTTPPRPVVLHPDSSTAQVPAFSTAKPCPGGSSPLAQITPDAATAGTPIPGSVESPTR